MIAILFFLLAAVLVIVLTWAFSRIQSQEERHRELESRLDLIEGQLCALRKQPPAAAQPTESAPVPEEPPEPAEQAPPPAVPPLLPPTEPEPPVLSSPVPSEAAPAPTNWEQFMGAKLFAWLGGLAAFLSAAFFVKYSFEHDLIPPSVRVSLGFLFAAALIAGGLRIRAEKYAVTAQTLCAAGIVSLYAVTFSCNAVYHFAFFGLGTTFVLMALITAGAFLTAVKRAARVVALLGMVGGFLTPVLLATGEDNAAELFGYVALLDLGLVAVALRRRWQYLVPLAAAGTVVMQVGWTARFFTDEKVLTAMAASLGFSVLFFLAHALARRLGRGTRETAGSAIALPFSALGFALFFLGYPAVAARPELLLSFVLLADAVLLALAWMDEGLPKLHLAAGLASFGLLAAWTLWSLAPELLAWALVFYFLHAVFHTAFPLFLQRRRPAAAPTWWSQLFPLLGLVLMLGPLFKLTAVSLLLWPFVLLLDLVVIGLAWLSASLVAILAALLLTLAAAGWWMFRMPAALAEVPLLLAVIGFFAGIFFCASLFLFRRRPDRIAAVRPMLPGLFGGAQGEIPALSALLPFLLLILMTQQLPLPNPSPVFDLALVLVVLVLGLSSLLSLEWLPACALAGVAALAFAWRATHPEPDYPGTPLVWCLAFVALFAVYPFVHRRRFLAFTGPWAVAALGGVLFFPIVRRLAAETWPTDYPGLVPALFALPPLVSLAVIRRSPVADERARLNQLAWFGGAALLFITLIIPIQFDREWITLGWALEGAALLWLFRKLPHRGLRAVGFVLLAIAFWRLALNPVVLSYHLRGATRLLNWYLYAYGIVIACLFAGARALGSDREPVLGLNARPVLNSLGTILAFVLLNIEIADFFSRPGSRALVFRFSGNFARDMTYTIAWALFALVLLLISIARKTKAGRRAAVALLSLAILKLFAHDLSRLDSLYRVGALLAVAAVAIAASFAYQRFLPGREQDRESGK